MYRYMLSILAIAGIKPENGENPKDYFAKADKQLELDKQKQQQEAEKVIRYQDKNIIINIKSYNLYNKPKPPKLFDIGKIELDDDNNEN